MEQPEPQKESIKLEDVVTFVTPRIMTMKEVLEEMEKRGLRLLTMEEAEALSKLDIKFPKDNNLLTKKKED